MRVKFRVPLIRRFCKVPGEILRSFRTSEDLSHCAGLSCAPTISLISSRIRLLKFSRSLLVMGWWLSSSILSTSGNSFLGFTFIVLFCYDYLDKIISNDWNKLPRCSQLGIIFLSKPCKPLIFQRKKNGFVKKPFLAFQGFVPFWSEIGVLPIRSQLGILCFLLKNGWHLFVIGITLF